VKVVLNESTQEKCVNSYRLGSVVGVGTFSKVKWAVDEKGTGFAVKVFSRGVLDRRSVAVFSKDGVDRVSALEVLIAELEMLKGLQHDHIVSLHEVIDDPACDDFYVIYGGMSGGTLLKFHEACHGYSASSDYTAVCRYWKDLPSCKDVEIDPAKGEALVFTENLARYLLPQLLEAVNFIHGQGIIHKDLKPENLLLSLPLPISDARFCRKLCNLLSWPTISLASPDQAAVESKVGSYDAKGAGAEDDPLVELLRSAGLTLRVCDFGSATVAESPDYLIYDAQGTQLFTPPECFAAAMYDSRGVPGKPRDIWSVGCVLFCMLYGRCPFWEDDHFSLQMSVIDCNLVVPESIVSASAMDYIKGLMQKEAADRLSATSALQHPWLRNS
jgi:serine/threonine protein kinase